MAATTSISIPKLAQEGILAFSKSCHDLNRQHWNIHAQMRQVDLAYMRENDFTEEHIRAKISNRYGDSNRVQNIQVPVVMPQVEAAVAYQSSVFLTGTPIFGCAASPQYEDAALMLETVIDNQSVRGGWTKELLLFFKDGFKYNLAAVEVAWRREVTAAIETDLSFHAKNGKPKEVIWEGNAIKRLDPYNIIFDSRVAPSKVHTHGEFVGYHEMMSRVALKDFINKLPDEKMIENITPAFESGLAPLDKFYVPQLNPDAILDRNQQAGTNWESWFGVANRQSKIQYSNTYEVTTLYGRIIPSDFGLRVPSANTPQVWKFIIVNSKVIIFAERQTNAHGLLPIMLCQPLEDGLNYQTKSFGSNVKPIQDVASALMNSVLASRRRAISDRTIYDPSRIRESDINSSNPSAKIPVRPSAYGKNLAESVYAFPFRDDQATTILSEIPQLLKFADLIGGQNPAQQGQFVKGNKTLHEYSDVMAHANSRHQTISLTLEAQVFAPMKEILKINILQYQGGTSLYNRSTKNEIAIDPLVLRKAVMEFKVSDGLTPTEKMVNGDALKTAIQMIGSSPAVSGEYNLGPMFSYLMKTQGAHIAEFEKSPEQRQYEQAVAQWQQAVEGIFKQNPETKQEQLPPQPKPADYGIGNDGKPTKPQQQPLSIVETINAQAAAAQTSPSPQPQGQ